MSAPSLRFRVECLGSVARPVAGGGGGLSVSGFFKALRVCVVLGTAGLYFTL